MAESDRSVMIEFTGRHAAMVRVLLSGLMVIRGCCSSTTPKPPGGESGVVSASRGDHPPLEANTGSIGWRARPTFGCLQENHR